MEKLGIDAYDFDEFDRDDGDVSSRQQIALNQSNIHPTEGTAQYDDND